MFLTRRPKIPSNLAESENRLRPQDQIEIVSFDDQRTALITQRTTLTGTINSTATQSRSAGTDSELDKQMQPPPRPSWEAATERRAEAESRLLNCSSRKRNCSPFKETTAWSPTCGSNAAGQAIHGNADQP